MPSDEALLQQAEEWKQKGNTAFQNNQVLEACKAYSQGVVICDRIGSKSTLKATLLSNRAMCYLKLGIQLQDCIDDCTGGLACEPDVRLRGKLLYRRAKATFMLANESALATNKNDLLQDAGKDLLQILQDDPRNKEAQDLLQTIRAQHKLQQRSTPVSKTLQALKDAEGDEKNALHHTKILMGLLDNDLSNASMELGRIGGVDYLLQVVKQGLAGKRVVLTMTCLSQAGSHPLFARTFLALHQKDLYEIAQSTGDADVVVSSLAVLMRVILHTDRDDPNKDIDGTTKLDYDTIVNMTRVCLDKWKSNTAVIRAVLDVWSTWTAGVDRDVSIRHSLVAGAHDPTVPIPKTQADIRSMSPQELAAHRKREYDQKTRDQAWAFERSMLICQKALPTYLQTAVQCQDHILRREMQVVLGRLLAALDDDEKIKAAVKAYLVADEEEEAKQKIVEVYNDDGEEKHMEEEEEGATLESKMQRALITAALLLSKKDVGAWALQFGWTNSGDELPDLIASNNKIAMCLASEVLSAAATVEASRHIVTNLTTSGSMEKLLMSDDRDIRSGAASAVAKLGLSTKSSDEGEVMGLLQAACELLEDKGEQEQPIPEKKNETKLRHFSSFATSSVERAIEMITYLVAQTIVKDELAAGFHSQPSSPHSALDMLVKTADIPNAGESLSGFGLATIFQHMAATNIQLRKEAFEGKEVTMEQYDEMQKLGKTQEEQEVLEAQQDPDTQASCNERIRKMASANVPRALVALTEGASEHTLEQVILALSRMAGEPSVRGLMIQQGVLSVCIKVEKNEGPTETDVMKHAIRLARHTIAKMLVTTNPSLLTSAQRLGSIKPLIQLVRDHKASDLQHFEALMALTNLAGSGDDAKTRISSEKGIGALHFAMFSSHNMVRRAATEAMCNLVPDKSMMEHLALPDNIRLWMAFAADYEENYECSRAATGCLAMATQDETIAEALIEVPKFREEMSSLLECGRLEIMHRAFVIVLNLVAYGGKCREKVVTEGLVAFCSAYADSYNDKDETELDFAEEELQLLPVTLDLAKKIVNVAES
jgi:protein unc-45